MRMGESVERLAVRLHQRLQRENKFLLILDDVWQMIDLDALGVPQPEVHTGSKIILTSRSLEICREMKTDEEVKVDVLNDEEAWQLFSRSAGKVATLKHIEPLARVVARECSGLPLAIITVGTAMRGKTMIELWKDALNELRRSVPHIRGIEDRVFRPLKWSYDSLQGKNIKPCFLYCALYPEDFSIEVSELVNCWLAEGLIDEQQNYEDLHNRGIALIENLKDSCLLEEGAHESTVKMHDVIRDVAIWISSSLDDGYKSLVRSGIGLTRISEAEMSTSLKRISFINNKIVGLPDRGIQCPEASSLLLQGNLPLERIPYGFLQAFQSLQILNVSGTNIQSLPQSILHLVDLKVLLLRDCRLLEELTQLGMLSKLQVLDCCATRIRELPSGMENLSNLRVLNISRTHYLQSIQSGILSRLSSLEVLEMAHSAYIWRQPTDEVLGCLGRLFILSARFATIPSFISEDPTWIGRLKRFQFYIGPEAISMPSKHDKRKVTIGGLDLSGEWICWFLPNASSFVLNHCRGLKQMLETLVIDRVDHFASLKSLTIASFNSSLRPDGGCAAHCDLLPNLEELRLQNLTCLENISELVGHLGLRFTRLKSMEVTVCPRLKCLLWVSFLPALPNLQKIEVSFCDELVELFNCSAETFVPEPIAPNLKTVELKKLGKLKTFYNHEQSWQSLEEIEVIDCNSLKQLPLTTHNANTIKEIRGGLRWWNNLHWKDVATRSSLQPYFKARTDQIIQTCR
ncbi:hypothetical protein Pint_04266 [Pistacia integerrima]|uniref:Uncharacterized protein n=1 Tax=Pistacia integerrima TaxID=434235 RepID=A0ACC0Z473_9ROSI|nr:hypothetical protein Pint_04266 [Pistacia integerrima]